MWILSILSGFSYHAVPCYVSCHGMLVSTIKCYHKVCNDTWWCLLCYVRPSFALNCLVPLRQTVLDTSPLVFNGILGANRLSCKRHFQHVLFDFAWFPLIFNAYSRLQMLTLHPFSQNVEVGNGHGSWYGCIWMWIPIQIGYAWIWIKKYTGTDAHRCGQIRRRREDNLAS